MSPESIVLLLVGTWLLVAAAMLWGVLRIARRHQRPAPAAEPCLVAGARSLANNAPAATAASSLRQRAGCYGQRMIRRLQ